jgi:hypothetical protein
MKVTERGGNLNLVKGRATELLEIRVGLADRAVGGNGGAVRGSHGLFAKLNLQTCHLLPLCFSSGRQVSCSLSNGQQAYSLVINSAGRYIFYFLIGICLKFHHQSQLWLICWRS